jgi:hypothetical protein
MDYLRELQAIYDSEINFRISCFWDGGWKIELGDDMNGWEDSKSTETLREGIDWLIKVIKEKYTNSGYAKGKTYNRRS